MSFPARSLRTRLLAIASAAGLLAGLGLATVAGPAAAQAPAAPLPTSDTGLWIVRLEGPSLAASRAPAGEVDVTTRESRAHLGQLASQHEEAAERLSEHLGRPVEVRHSLRNVLNAIVIEAEPEEAASLTEVPGVAAVEPDVLYEPATDASNDLIGTPAFWDGDTGPGLSTQGEGTVVGVIDFGINPDHPSFAATDGDGFTHTNPYSGYLGVCDPAHPDHQPICNDKLVGAWSFLNDPSPVDTDGHGSHVASLAVGNRHDVTISHGADDLTRTVQGVAPRANLVAYKVCDLGCSSLGIAAAVDQAIIDDVDALNVSITGGDSPWGSTVSLAFLEAFGVGIFIATAASNTDNPGPGTVDHTAPWNATVANTTSDRTFANTLSVLGPAPVPPELAAIPAWPGHGPGNTVDLDAELRYAAEFGREDGCTAYPPGSLTGAIVVAPRGACFPAGAIDEAAAAGAEAIVIFEPQPGPPLFLKDVEDTTIPAVSVDQAAGEALRDLVYTTSGPVTVRLGADTAVVHDPAAADRVVWSSARGPSRFDVLAPALSAPGANIFGAYRALPGDPVQYSYLRGTSMSSPHVAGAGALLTALHPDWSPAEIRAALAGTADPTGVVTADGAPADPFDIGAGRVDLAAAARVGLVMDETYTNMADADPDDGGDPRTLNVPYLMNRECGQGCMWTREVTSVADASASYTATVDVPAGMTATVSPSTFTLAPDATQSLTITVDISGSSGGDWVFGDVVLSSSDLHAGGEPIADVHYPVAVIPTNPAMNVEPAAIEASQKPGQQRERALAIQNHGNVPLAWNLAGGTGCDLPSGVPWLAASELSGTVPVDDSAHPGLTLDATGLSPGTHTATLCVAGDDPGLPQVEVPVTMTVLDAPTIEVTPPEVVTSQPPGTVTNTPLTIDNPGTAALDWSFGEAAVEVDPAALAGVDPARRALLESGVLLVPDPSIPGIAAFDPRTGDLLDPAFITYPTSVGSSTVKIVLHPDGDGFLVSSWSSQEIYEFDLNGTLLGVFADSDGPSELDRPRGMAVSPAGTVLVASSLNHKVAEFDATGQYLGDFIPTGGGGIDTPKQLLFRDNDLLVSSDRGITQFDHSGVPLSVWNDEIDDPRQLAEQPDGNVLVAEGQPANAVSELTPDGELVGRYTGVDAGNLGVHPLANGNILVRSNSSGVQEIDRGATVLATEATAGFTQFAAISEVGPLVACDLPGDVPWLSLSASSGTTTPGGTSPVTVDVDSTALTPGLHQATLCLLSNDPDTPVLPVPVTVTVTGTATSDCTVNYEIDNQWADGFQAAVEIVNTSDTTVDGWTLTWTFTDGQEIQDLWNGDHDQTGPDVTVDDLGWNGTILPSGSVSFGFTASHTGTNPDPTDLALNGAPCDT